MLVKRCVIGEVMIYSKVETRGGRQRRIERCV